MCEKEKVLIMVIQFIFCVIFIYQVEMSIWVEECGLDVVVICIFFVFGVVIVYWVDFGFMCMFNQIFWVSSVFCDFVFIQLQKF